MILEVKNLSTSFYTRNGIYKAVKNISFSVAKGKTLGIVGESGSGKSVSQYSYLGLIPTPPGKIENGQAMFQGIDLLKLSQKQLQKYRGSKISIIFQDPMTCLNPYLKISTQLIEPLLIHKNMSKKQALILAEKSLEEVGISDYKKRLHAYPHEFSGGMRQRVMIAMALITEPELLIADEPTTALDVTVQAQILELINELQKKKETAVVFITHDLGVISNVADDVAVMYAGEIVEQASAKNLFTNPSHPYTKALLKSIPANHQAGEKLFSISGLPPDLSKEIIGCSFTPRTSHKTPCNNKASWVEIDSNHWVMKCPQCFELGI